MLEVRRNLDTAVPCAMRSMGLAEWKTVPTKMWFHKSFTIKNGDFTTEHWISN
jgi:hypothetical protein